MDKQLLESVFMSKKKLGFCTAQFSSVPHHAVKVDGIETALLLSGYTGINANLLYNYEH